MFSDFVPRCEMKLQLLLTGFVHLDFVHLIGVFGRIGNCTARQTPWTDLFPNYPSNPRRLSLVIHFLCHRHELNSVSIFGVVANFNRIRCLQSLQTRLDFTIKKFVIWTTLTYKYLHMKKVTVNKNTQTGVRLIFVVFSSAYLDCTKKTSTLIERD
jgi:E3 ubiquitin-protein ligase DOA10